MPSPEMAAIAYGIASAVSWGGGDFVGGLATRRGNVISVVVASQIVGVILLGLAAGVMLEPWPEFPILLLGAAAGVSGMIGLIALYQGLADGRMGIVAPLAALVTAILPVSVSAFWEGRPPPAQMAAFGLALAGVVLISGAGSATVVKPRELSMPVLAGTGFGLFYIFLDRAADSAVLWPLVSARVASITLLLIYTSIKAGTSRSLLPLPRSMPLVILAGVGDSGGNVLFALAARLGRLDLASVLASLYPTVTILLAWVLLQEKVARLQMLGFVLILAALALITSSA